MKRRNYWIIPIVLMILLGGVFLLNGFKSFGNKNVKESLVEKKIKYDSIVGDFGRWETMSYFTSSSSNIEVYDSYIIYHNNEDPLEDNEVTLHFTTQVSENYIDSIAAGRMVYRFDATNLFFNDSSFEGYSIDTNNNQVLFYDGNDVKGYIKFGSDMPYCNFYSNEQYDVSSCSGSNDYYWYYDANGLKIINGNTISDLDSYSVDLSATFALDSSYSLISGFSEIVNSFQLLDYEDSYLEYPLLMAEIYVPADQIDLSNIHNEEEIEYDEWQSEWGTDNTNYNRFLVYPVTGYIDFDGFFMFNFIFLDEYDVVAYSEDGENYVAGDINDFYSNEACSVETEGYSDVICYIVVGYNVTSTVSVDFQLELDVSTYDGSDVLSFEWNHIFQGDGPIIEPEYPEGISKSFVQRNNSVSASEGAINKLLDGDSVNYSWTVEAGLGNINNGFKAFNLWNLTNNGTESYTVELGSDGEEIDSSYASSEDPYSLNGTDYSIISFYPLSDYEYDYVLNGNNSYELQLVNDYSSYTAKDVYVSINDGSFEKIGSYVGNGSTIVYTALDDRTSSNNDVSESNPVVLPSNVTKIKVVYSGVRAAVYIGYNFNTVVNGTEAVINKINDLNDVVVLKNATSLNVNDEIDVDTKGTYLTKIEVNSYSSSTATVGEKIDEGRTDVISYEDRFYEQINYTQENKDDVLDILVEQTYGTLYELLPTGAELYGDVAVKTIGNNSTCSSTKDVQTNYNGTGRALLTINIGDCESNIYDTGSAYQSGYVVNFDIKYTALANQSYGTVLDKDTMYEANNTLGDGYSSASEANSSSFSSESVRTIFDNLVTGNNNLLFTTVQVEVEGLSISVGTYSKEVKGINDSNYLTSTNVAEGTSYTYKLQYAFTSEMENITNVVIVDNLENYDSNNTFRGYLDDIDVSYLENLGIDVTIYYSTTEVSETSFDASQWSTSRPVNAETIKAIAIDCGNYIFRGNSSEAPLVYVTMQAPNGYQENISAKNKSVIFYQYIGEGVIKSLDTEVTTVSLEAADIELTGSSSEGVGTESNPAVVSGDYYYSFNVKNNDNNYTFNDIVMAVKLPVGLNYVGNRSASTTYDSDSRTVYFNIDSLGPQEEETLSFDVEIVFNEINGDNTLFVVDYYIDSLNGNAYDGEVNKLYNKLELPTLEFNKYVNTSDTNGFSDEATILITKGETYSYRVTVENTSDVAAKDILVVDTVPEGLTVVNIGNSGTYDGDVHTITWNISELAAGSSVNLEYDVKVGDDIRLGTRYRSSAHVTLVNPLSSSDYLYDIDTNIITTLYQVASDIKVNNVLVGALADTSKQFSYIAEFQGGEANVGTYDINDGSGDKIGELTINSEGYGSYSFTLKGGDAVEFKLLPGGIEYIIKQAIEEGYETTIVDSEVNNGYVEIFGVTNETRKVNYIFTNTYDVSTSVSLSAKVTYEKEMTEGMFKAKISGDNTNLQSTNDSSGNFSFAPITYDNEVGQYTYTIEQIDTGESKVVYDTKVYTAVVNVTDDSVGNLNKTVKYYDSENNEVEAVVFENTYLPNGLLIQNINSSDYVDPNKEFNYELSLEGDIDPEASYRVLDNTGQELGNISFVDGEASYSFTLKSNESLTIMDLPPEVNYTIIQEIPAYYNAKVEQGTYTLSDDEVSTSGVTIDGNVQVKFINNYETSGSFSPSAKVTLEGKELENQEFTFMIVDVSEGMTNGYTIVQKNNADGEIDFGEIEYTRPGTYTYEITQVSTNSNHVYYDNNKIILTVELTDNGDGTMEVLGTYQYFNDEESFINKYSEEPIVPEEQPQEEVPNNPNTLDRTIMIFILLVIVIALIIVERGVRQRRYALKG